MAKVAEVELIYSTASGANFTQNVPEPRADLTRAQALAAMNIVIAKNIFATKSGDLVGIVDARIHTSETTALA